MEFISLFFYVIIFIIFLIIAVYIGRINLYTKEIRDMLKKKFQSES